MLARDIAGFCPQSINFGKDAKYRNPLGGFDSVFDISAGWQSGDRIQSRQRRFDSGLSLNE